LDISALYPHWREWLAQ
jgi:hypothetical protein